jgi:hypothetical protein
MIPEGMLHGYSLSHEKTIRGIRGSCLII